MFQLIVLCLDFCALAFELAATLLAKLFRVSSTHHADGALDILGLQRILELVQLYLDVGFFLLNVAQLGAKTFRSLFSAVQTLNVD